MPAIQIFGRRTYIGGDDLQPAAAATMIVRALQITLLILPLTVKTALHQYPITYTEETLWAYLVSSFLYCFFSICLENNVYHISSIGTPTVECETRSSKMAQILKFKLTCMFIFQIIVFGLGIFSATTLAASSGSDTNFSNTTNSTYASIPMEELLLVQQSYRNLLLREAAYIKSSSEEDITSNNGNMFFPSSWWLILSFLLATQATEILVTIFSWCFFLQLPKSRRSSNFAGITSSPTRMIHHHSHYGAMEEIWKNRCRFFCKVSGIATCYLFGGREIDSGGEFGPIARILTDYFEDGGDFDVVPSDIVMGLMLLWRIQKQRQIEATQRALAQKSKSASGSSSVRTNDNDVALDILQTASSQDLLLNPSNSNNEFDNDGDAFLGLPPKNTTIPTPREAFVFKIHHCGSRHFYDCNLRNCLSPEDEYDRSIMAEGARFARYALAIYTWKLLVYMKPIQSICHFCVPRRHEQQQDEDTVEPCSSSYLPFQCVVEGDNCCSVNEAALLAQAGDSSDSCELVYARFDNGLIETPHCVVIDRKWKSVVLSIRGSLSLEDCLTDVLCDPESLEKLGMDYGFDGHGEYCHSGVVNRVEWLHDNLERNGVLAKLLLDPLSEFHDYSLRIVGHSLGAGCAIVLGFMLKKKYPNLRCLLYSPPGGLMTWNSATQCKDYVTSFVLDNELVPRLSVENLEQLRDEVLELILRTKVPKIEVARDFVAKAAVAMMTPSNSVDWEGLFDDDEDILYSKGSAPMDSKFARQLVNFKEIQQQRKEHRGRVPVTLFPPGKIVHVVKTSEVQSWSNTCWKCITCCTSNAGFKYTPMWANNDDFNEIVISSTMGTDHFPNRVCIEIERTANSFFVEDISENAEEANNSLFKTK